MRVFLTVYLLLRFFLLVSQLISIEPAGLDGCVIVGLPSFHLVGALELFDGI